MRTDLGTCLKQHIDRYLGPTPSAITAESRHGLRAATFDDAPEPKLKTILTIGLSGHLLHQQSGRDIRQELMATFDRRFGSLPWAEVLLAAATVIVQRHTPVQRGEVLGPAGPLFPEAPWCHATALLCTPPSFFGEEFSEPEFEEERIVFVELIPITTEEAEWIGAQGWSKFFDRVNRDEINILDLQRPG